MSTAENNGSGRDLIIDAFGGGLIDRPLFLPNLSLWYDWHAEKGTLSAPWGGCGLDEICLDLNVPVWQTARPWRRNWATDVKEEQTDTSRVVDYHISGKVLTAKWILGPGGDWWQSEYPVKTDEDLSLLGQLFDGLTYEMLDNLPAAPSAIAAQNGITAIELPMEPYSFLLQHFLGWSEGLMIAMMNAELVSTLTSQLKEKFLPLVSLAAASPGDFLYAPDNLDGSFLSPTIFESEMAGSYTESAKIADQVKKPIIVHAGGMIKNLAPLLADAGVDVVEGISGPPQSDLGLRDGRVAVKEQAVLWGGIPQDALLATFAREDFETVVLAARKEAADSGGCVVGVADRVPIETDIERLKWVAELFT